MKKISIALMALILCFSMVMGVGATSDGVVAEAATTQAIPTEKPLEDTLGDLLGAVIGDNKEEVEDTTDSISSISDAIAKILDALDKFLRAFGVFVTQFLDKVLGNGSLPF